MEGFHQSEYEVGMEMVILDQRYTRCTIVELLPQEDYLVVTANGPKVVNEKNLRLPGHALVGQCSWID